MLASGDKTDVAGFEEGAIKNEDDDDSDSEVEKMPVGFKGSLLTGSSITEADIIDLIKSEYLPIKGIVALSNFRYRVQLNTFKHERRKFSRNSNDLMEVSNSKYN